VFPVEVRSTRVEGDGETALFSIVRDISESRQAEDAVRTSELKFRTVADFAYDWEAWNAPDGSYRYVSPSCERITGHTAEEFMADPYLTVRITHPDDLEASEEHHRAAEAESRAEDLELDFRIVLPDGETRWINHLCTPVYGEDGEWLGRRESNRDITAQKQAEEALLDARWRLESIIEGTHVGTWEWNVQTGETILNERWAEIVGYTLDELSPTSIKTEEALVHPDDLARSDEMLARHYSGELPYYDCELRLKHKDGHWVWVQDRGRVITRTDDGQPLMMFGTHADISDRKRAEQALSESEELFRALFESATDGVWLVATDGAIVAVNAAMARTHGYSVEEMQSMNIGSIDAPESALLAPARLKRLMAGEPLSFESEHLHKDGHIIPFDVSASIVTVGNVKYVVGFDRDITERRQAEQLISVYAELLEASPAAITVHTPEGKFVYANERTLEMHGYTRDEFLALDLHEIDVPEDAALIDERFRATAALGENTFEVAHYRKDGTVIPLAVSNRVAIWDGKEVLLSVATDITERKLAESELERHGAQLEELLAERERNLEQLALSLSSVTEVVSQVVESRDPYTAGHQRRVAALAVRIAEDLGMSAPQIDEIRIAALLHDVGKISVPAEILSKPGKLSALEFELIKGHSEAGYRILASANMGGEIAEIVYQHQERCDCSGYPRGLCGDELLPGAKVLMVADIVEAMSSHRPYRVALGVDAALAEIERGAGRQYDAEVAEACRRVIDAGFVFAEL
jgi:PAS domain S-box-containing protein/putative nucleotidyltransferase with HDIG domain